MNVDPNLTENEELPTGELTLDSIIEQLAAGQFGFKINEVVGRNLSKLIKERAQVDGAIKQSIESYESFLRVLKDLDGVEGILSKLETDEIIVDEYVFHILLEYVGKYLAVDFIEPKTKKQKVGDIIRKQHIETYFLNLEAGLIDQVIVLERVDSTDWVVTSVKSKSVGYRQSDKISNFKIRKANSEETNKVVERISGEA